MSKYKCPFLGEYVGTECTDGAMLLIEKLFPADNCTYYTVEDLRLILSGQMEVSNKEYFIAIMPRYYYRVF